MFLHRKGALLLGVALAGLTYGGLAPQATAASMDGSTEQDTMRVATVETVRATVVDISNDNDILVRMPDGNYRWLPVNNVGLLSNLDTGSEVMVTLVNNRVARIEMADVMTADAEMETEPSEDAEVTVVETETETEVTTTQTETTQESVVVQQRETVRPAPAPAPVVSPAAPVRGLW